MFYGDYNYYKQLKLKNINKNKDDEEILSAEKLHPNWLYKVTKEVLNNIIEFHRIRALRMQVKK